MCTTLVNAMTRRIVLHEIGHIWLDANTSQSLLPRVPWFTLVERVERAVGAPGPRARRQDHVVGSRRAGADSGQRSRAAHACIRALTGVRCLNRPRSTESRLQATCRRLQQTTSALKGSCMRSGPSCGHAHTDPHRIDGPGSGGGRPEVDERGSAGGAGHRLRGRRRHSGSNRSDLGTSGCASERFLVCSAPRQGSTIVDVAGEGPGTGGGGRDDGDEKTRWASQDRAWRVSPTPVPVGLRRPRVARRLRPRSHRVRARGRAESAVGGRTGADTGCT